MWLHRSRLNGVRVDFVQGSRMFALLAPALGSIHDPDHDSANGFITTPKPGVQEADSSSSTVARDAAHRVRVFRPRAI